MQWRHNVMAKWVKAFKNGPSKFVEGSLQKICSDMVCLAKAYLFKFFKDCLPQILLGPFLNTLTQIFHREQNEDIPKYLLQNTVHTRIESHQESVEHIHKKHHKNTMQETKPLDMESWKELCTITDFSCW